MKRIIVPSGTVIEIDRADVILTKDVSAFIVYANEQEIMLNADCSADLPIEILEWNKREGYLEGFFAIAV